LPVSGTIKSFHHNKNCDMAQNSQEAQALKITLHSDIGLFDVHYLSRVGSTPVLR